MSRIRIVLPFLETERIYLRELRRSDAPDIYRYAQSPEVGPRAGWQPHANLDDTYRFIDYAIRKKDFGQPGLFVIMHKADKRLIGTIEIHSYQEHKGEIGFVLDPDYWNQGLITEAAKAVIVWAMEGLELKRLTYCHFPDNLASKRVCEKLGFTFEGVLRNKFLMYDGTVRDDVTYSITDEDYFGGRIDWVERFKQDLFIDY